MWNAFYYLLNIFYIKVGILWTFSKIKILLFRSHVWLKHMNGLKIVGKDLFSWRKKQLLLGGNSSDLDWLLDLGGGISWCQLQELYLNLDHCVVLERSLDQLSKIWETHIKEQMPLQHLIGKCPWRDFEVEVAPTALIPRQETEILLELALERIGKSQYGRWADLGTGSGAIAVALSRSLPSWYGHLVDLSSEALVLASRNMYQLAPPSSNFQIHLGSWWEPLRPWWGSFDLVLSNPPYIPTSLLSQLDPVVLDHEPLLALNGGQDGLSSYRQILNSIISILKPGGLIFFEHHYDQSDSILELMRQSGLEEVEAKRDLEGVYRFAIGKNP